MPRRQGIDRNAARFGVIIRRLREAKRWTLVEFGRKAGMNPTYLGFLERGRAGQRTVKISFQRAAAVAFVAQLLLVPYARSAKLRNHHDHLIRQVSVSRASVNPSSGESLALHISLYRAAPFGVQVVDRDGFVIRTFPLTNGVAGDNRVVWDGRNEAGQVVPDEAYSFRVVADGGADEYFPSARAADMVAIDPLSYSRATATLSYRLRVPSRVHVQAGTVRTGADGPVLKTVVDRQPRDAGMIAEHWSGFDESGSLYVPDLAGFAIAIAATPLPENSVITYGNAKQPFLEYAARRVGHSLFRQHAHGAHHAGLDVFNDLAPRLTVTLTNGVHRPSERLWIVTAPLLRLQMRANGPTADAFLRQPGKILVFVDAKLVATTDARKGADVLDVPLPADGEHVVAVNWRSDYGPVAVAVAKVRRNAERQTAQKGSRP
jgi:transcriptional regulator with XRE-family HTH domain